MKKRTLIFLSGLCMMFLHGQGSYDPALLESLTEKSYEALEDGFNAAKYDFAKAEIYAKAYLKKSIDDKNTIRQANSHYFLSEIHTPIISEQYADSIIIDFSWSAVSLFSLRMFIAIFIVE